MKTKFIILLAISLICLSLSGCITNTPSFQAVLSKMDTITAIEGKAVITINDDLNNQKAFKIKSIETEEDLSAHINFEDGGLIYDLYIKDGVVYSLENGYIDEVEMADNRTPTDGEMLAGLMLGDFSNFNYSLKTVKISYMETLYKLSFTFRDLNNVLGLYKPSDLPQELRDMAIEIKIVASNSTLLPISMNFNIKYENLINLNYKITYENFNANVTIDYPRVVLNYDSSVN